MGSLWSAENRGKVTYPWLKIPRAQARRKIERHGHASETK